MIIKLKNNKKTSNIIRNNKIIKNKKDKKIINLITVVFLFNILITINYSFELQLNPNEGIIKHTYLINNTNNTYSEDLGDNVDLNSFIIDFTGELNYWLINQKKENEACVYLNDSTKVCGKIKKYYYGFINIYSNDFISIELKDRLKIIPKSRIKEIEITKKDNKLIVKSKDSGNLTVLYKTYGLNWKMNCMLFTNKRLKCNAKIKNLNNKDYVFNGIRLINKPQNYYIYPMTSVKSLSSDSELRSNFGSNINYKDISEFSSFDINRKVYLPANSEVNLEIINTKIKKMNKYYEIQACRSYDAFKKKNAIFKININNTKENNLGFELSNINLKLIDDEYTILGESYINGVWKKNETKEISFDTSNKVFAECQGFSSKNSILKTTTIRKKMTIFNNKNESVNITIIDYPEKGKVKGILIIKGAEKYKQYNNLIEIYTVVKPQSSKEIEYKYILIKDDSLIK